MSRGTVERQSRERKNRERNGRRSAGKLTSSLGSSTQSSSYTEAVMSDTSAKSVSDSVYLFVAVSSRPHYPRRDCMTRRCLPVSLIIAAVFYAIEVSSVSDCRGKNHSECRGRYRVRCRVGATRQRGGRYVLDCLQWNYYWQARPRLPRTP